MAIRIGEIANILDRAGLITNRSLVRPTREAFDPGELEGVDAADHIFKRVQEHLGVALEGCDLTPHASAHGIVPDVIGSHHHEGPGGTYSQEGGDEGRSLITYDPGLLDQPVDLIATLAHEIGHHLIHHCDGLVADAFGEDEEHATDLYTIFNGFGLFQLRSSLRMESWSSGQMSGWSVKNSGYLSLPESAYALALFAKRNGIDARIIENHLDDMHHRAFVRARKQVGRGL